MNTESETFAVDLSNDGIFLWHRKPAHKWEFLGSVPLDAGNLRQQLEKLKAIASSISAPSRDAIVRIPSGEVKTLTVAHDAKTDSNWEVRIASALEAAANAPIKTLAFDIDRRDGTSDISIAWTQMAVIKQAETFVHLIGFKPTRYTTDVSTNEFPRNPSFQITQPAETHEDPRLVPEDADFEHETDATLLEVEPALDDLAPAQEKNKQVVNQKSDFDLFWFVALFLILGLIIAAIYYWPGFEQYWPNQQGALEIHLNAVQDQLFSAVWNNSSANGFEKSKTIL